MEKAEGSPWFWSVIATSEKRLNLLARQLEKMSREELLQYASEYEEAKDAINPYASDNPIWPTDGFSEDTADDFAVWVVSLGDGLYDQLRAAPLKIHEFFRMFDEAGQSDSSSRWDDTVDRPEYRGWQNQCGLAAIVYETRFGRTFSEDLEKYERRDSGERS
jgi:Protein of unknown function (DUF4240)